MRMNHCFLILSSIFFIDGVKALNNWRPFQSIKPSSQSSLDILKSEILNLISDTNRGLSELNKDEIIKSIQQVSKLPTKEREKGSVDGQWKLLWTTEKVIFSLFRCHFLPKYIYFEQNLITFSRKLYFSLRMVCLVVNVLKFCKLLIGIRTIYPIKYYLKMIESLLF